MKRVLIVVASVVGLGLTSVVTAAPEPGVKTSAEVLRDKKKLHGQVIAIAGFIRFDRLSRRGFLYSQLKDLRSLDYTKTIFLELGNENLSSLKIPDGKYVIVRGYLSEDLRGPLGVYPAHVIVNRIDVRDPKSR